MSRSKMLMNYIFIPKDDEEWGTFIRAKAKDDVTG